MRELCTPAPLGCQQGTYISQDSEKDQGSPHNYKDLGEHG